MNIFFCFFYGLGGEGTDECWKCRCRAQRRMTIYLTLKKKREKPTNLGKGKK
jgi:hypothetical protein